MNVIVYIQYGIHGCPYRVIRVGHRRAGPVPCRRRRAPWGGPVRTAQSGWTRPSTRPASKAWKLGPGGRVGVLERTGTLPCNHDLHNNVSWVDGGKSRTQTHLELL